MPTLLVLNSSLNGANSVSRFVVEEAVRQITRRDPAVEVVHRDLAVHPLPHLTPATVAGVRATPTTAAEFAAQALSNELIAELKAADAIVIGAPMYNFSIPSTLRTWFDHVLRPGVTFSYSAAGAKGLIADKPVIIVESRGALYSEGPGAALDFQEPYLRQLLAFIGLTDVTFVHAEKVGYGPEARAEAIAGATAHLTRVTTAVCESKAA